MYNQPPQQTLQQYLSIISDKLSKTIIQLESDQVIQQMRNDKSLYQFKLTHIKQIIDQHFNFGEQMNQLLQENGKLKQNLIAIEQKMIQKNQQFNQAIDIIQDGAKKHTKVKEQEILRLTHIIKELQGKLNIKLDASVKANKKTNQLSSTVQNLQLQNQKLTKQLSKIKQEYNKLQQVNKKLKSSYKQSDHDHERSIHMLKTQYQKQIQQYENLTKKMQNDMLIIKTQWQKKCTETERQLRQFYQGQIVKLQDRKSRELINHLQTMKQGKPVIIKQDQQVMSSRIQSIKRQYQIQIEKLQKNNQQLHQLYQNLQNTSLPKTKQIQALSDALKNVRNEFQIEKQSWTAQKQRSKRQIQKLRGMALQLQRNNKQILLNYEHKQAQAVKLSDSIKFTEKKLEISTRSLAQQKNLFSQKQDQLVMLNNKYNNLEDMNKKMKKNLDQIQGQAQVKNKKLDSLNKQLQKITQKLSQTAQSNQNLKSELKTLKTLKQKLRKTVDKLFLQLKHSQKQVALLKQDVKYMCQFHRKKHFTQFQKLIDQIQIYRQNVQKDTKNKMNELINEIQQAKQAEHVQFQGILRERQNLKRQVAQLQDLFTKKQMQVQEAKRNILNAQTDQVKRVMLQDIQRERIKYQRLEQQLITTQKNHHNILQKTKNQVKSAIKVLTNKWIEQMSKLEEDNKKKQIQLQKIVQKVQGVILQSEQMRKSIEVEKQQSRRIRKKYQTVKQQKQQQINELMKRLERQSKHKINLQKQLRTIRSQLNKGERISKQFTERESKNIGNKLMTDREKQFSQMKELIAKTYQFVGEKAQKDNKWDKADRIRSPY